MRARNGLLLAAREAETDESDAEKRKRGGLRGGGNDGGSYDYGDKSRKRTRVAHDELRTSRFHHFAHKGSRSRGDRRLIGQEIDDLGALAA